jgi:hydroxyacylglutathione hydrolase
MYFENIFEKGLAQASYLIGCQATREAIVIDPRRDIEDYLKIAEREKLKITRITETHIHADFLSGTRELQAATGAEVLLSDEGGADWEYRFGHTGLKDGDIIKVGNLKIEVLHTPGHTPEHISFLLTDTAASPEPVMIFTGDFVFVGDVGRPDLLEKAAGIKGTMDKGARDMFRSLKKFSSLPDFVQVWPAHGAGSACGKSLGAVPSSTVGYEKLVNWALNITDEDEFVNTLLDGQPEPPKYFAMMKKLNKEGVNVLGGMPHPARLTFPKFQEAIDNNVKIIDTRNKLSFAGGHVKGSINIQDNSSFTTWAGWVLDYDEPFVLIAPGHRIEELTKALIRIGLDNISGFLPDMNAWADAGNELKRLNQLSASELSDKLLAGDAKVIDVRGYTEYNRSHIPGAENIFVGYLAGNPDKLSQDSPIVLHCTSGDRSSLAASLLQREGFNNVYNLPGGMEEWTNEKLPLAGNPVKKDAV